MEREWVQLIGFSQESDYTPLLYDNPPSLSLCVFAANWQEDAMSDSLLPDGFGNFAEKSNAAFKRNHSRL